MIVDIFTRRRGLKRNFAKAPWEPDPDVRISRLSSQCGVRAYLNRAGRQELRACCNCGLFHPAWAFKRESPIGLKDSPFVLMAVDIHAKSIRHASRRTP